MVGILAEKPSAARNFAKALGGASGTYKGEQYLIVASHGHLFEFLSPDKQVLPALSEKYRSWDVKNLPWDENDFSWKKGKKSGIDSVLNSINSGLSKCDEIVIATDVDPSGEGELLAWEILDALHLQSKVFSRMYFMDEAVDSIRSAFEKRKPISCMMQDMDYVKADYRSKFDYLTMQFTRIATASGDGRSVLRQGRLKSAMVLLVGNQLDLIAKYKPTPFYQNRFSDENGVVYTNPDEEKYSDKSQVPALYHESGVTLDSKTICHTAPPRLLDLASLSARLSSQGYRAQSVLDVYQKMYENQVVSYPRTEDKKITPEQFNELLPKVSSIAALVGVDTALLTHTQPRSTHVKVGGAHGANRPGPNVPSSLSALDAYDTAGAKGLAQAIYVMLARNYLAMLAEDYEYEAQKGHVTDYPAFVGSANVPKKAGWKDVFSYSEDDDSDSDDTVIKGLGTKATPFVYEGKPTRPATPTMKWLMKQLEKHDVGTGATRTSIYADVTNEKTKYPLLVESKGKLRMAPCGDMSYRLLPDTHIGNLQITEQLQADMRDIAAGKLNPDVCLAKMQQMVRDDLKVMQANGMAMREALGIKMASPADYATGVWHGKDVRFKRSWGGHAFTDDEVQRLLAGEDVCLFGLQGKNGPYNVKGHLDEQTFKGKPFVGFAPLGYVNDDGTDKVSNANSADYCTGTWKKKKVRFKKVWGGHTFTDDECSRLLAGEEISFSAKRKDGSDYTVKGSLANQSYNGNKYVGFKPDFDTNKKSSGRSGKTGRR